MRDRHFREDENELPYLVSEKRDGYRGSGSVQLRMDFEDVPFRDFRSYIDRLLMPRKDKVTIINSIKVNPKNYICSISQDGHVVDINLVLKNKYLSSRFHFRYDSEMQFLYPFHDHSILKSSQWFKDEVRRVENEICLKYDACGGGYRFHFEDDTLEVLDEIEVLVYFSDGGEFSDSHSYKVDFKNKNLVEYHVHDWFELNALYL